MQEPQHVMRTTIRVISLARDPQRRVAFTERAQATNVAWSFFDACTSLSPALTYDEEQAIVRRGRPMMPAELGCYSSHYSTWVEFLASSAEQLIVMEDDTLIDWEYLRKVAEHDFSANNVHYLRLASMAVPPAIYKGELLGRYLVHYLGYALGTQAYLLTRKGAQHLVEHMRTVRGPIDDALDQSWWGSLPNYGLYHHPVMEMAGPSRIGAARNASYQLNPRLKLRRLWFRVQEKLRSRGYRLWMRLGGGPRVSGVDARWL
jgi:glycosyl transferase, family 25